jgi:hypothetical protein
MAVGYLRIERELDADRVLRDIDMTFTLETCGDP